MAKGIGRGQMISRGVVCHIPEARQFYKQGIRERRHHLVGARAAKDNVGIIGCKTRMMKEGMSTCMELSSTSGT